MNDQPTMGLTFGDGTRVESALDTGVVGAAVQNLADQAKDAGITAWDVVTYIETAVPKASATAPPRVVRVGLITRVWVADPAEALGLVTAEATEELMHSLDAADLRGQELKISVTPAGDALHADG